MKIILSILFILAINMGSVFSQSFEVTELGRGANPKWSPDGKYLAFTNSQGLNVWVVDSQIVRQVCAPEETHYMNAYNYDWESPTSFLFIQKVNKRKSSGIEISYNYKRISLDGNVDLLYSEKMSGSGYIKSFLRHLSNSKLVVNRMEPVGVDVLKGMLGLKVLDTTAYFVTNIKSSWWNNEWIKPGDKGLWLVRSNGDPVKLIEKNKGYRLPILSPDSKHIFCTIGQVVIDLDGKVIGQFGPRVDLSGWLPDNERVVYMKTRESNDDIGESEIYIADMTGENEIELTSTINKIELWPTVSPDLTKIAYVNYAEGGNYIEILNVGDLLK